MKKILFATNVPSPYRVDFFNELGKYCDLTVCFERQSASDRDKKWVGAQVQSFTPIYLGSKPLGADRSVGLELTTYIRKHKNEIVILTNYASPSTIIAIIYCRLFQIPYYIEHDGGFNRKDSFLKGILKKFLLCGARAHFTTCNSSIEYLKSLGISATKIYKYPFTSLSESDLQNIFVSRPLHKMQIRKALGMQEEHIVISVGRFTYQNGYGKGYDVVLRAAAKMGPEIGFYIIGDEPTKEFEQMQEDYHATNVHFILFKTKDELSQYFLAADIFVLMTIYDIWGLVINEAMAYGLPIISTDKCIAALELVEPGYNGYILPVGDEDKLADSIHFLLQDEARCQQYGRNSRNRIQSYTIEEMAKRHMEIFEDIQSKK